MNPIVRNILAVILGLFIGGAVNMGIITVSASIIPPPEGVDMTTPEGIAAAMPLLEPKHFIMPWLAHALGTLAGAVVAAMVAASRKMTLALSIGGFFLIGGIMMVMMVPSPGWFTAADLVLAYIPMAYIGGKLAARRK